MVYFLLQNYTVLNFGKNVLFVQDFVKITNWWNSLTLSLFLTVHGKYYVDTNIPLNLVIWILEGKKTFLSEKIKKKLVWKLEYEIWVMYCMNERSIEVIGAE